MSSKNKRGNSGLRTAMIVLIVALAFVASYQLAVAANGDGSPGGAAARSTSGGLVTASNGGSTSGSSGSPACACCGGNTGTGETIEGAAVVENGVQKISVDASNGYNPNRITLAAGVPAEITFANGTGCLGQVMSKDFGFFEDLTTGPKTVRIEADKLQPGEYEFSCGMQMVFGTIVVE